MEGEAFVFVLYVFVDLIAIFCSDLESYLRDYNSILTTKKGNIKVTNTSKLLGECLNVLCASY